MIYHEICKNLDKLDAAWQETNKAIDLLTAKVPTTYQIPLKKLKTYGSQAMREIATEPGELQKQTTVAAMLAEAADFLGTDPGSIGVNETSLTSSWDALWRKLSEPEKKSAKAEKDHFEVLLMNLGVIRLNCLMEIHELQSDNTGVAATNIADAVRGTADAVKDVSTYPLLTQEVGYPPSPLATPAQGGTSGLPGAAVGPIAIKAINDVLGWKQKPGDVKGFLGALSASFTCKDVEGHTECTWTPRTYAVATDLAGGITGAQASIYSRAQKALELSLPLLDGLYALDPTTDTEEVDALRKVARDQMNELVAELGMLGGPRTWRVAQYFSLLLGTDFPLATDSVIKSKPDEIEGTLGTLRNILGIQSNSKFVNSIEDEQDVTNFRILSDYMTSLAQSWVNDLEFFMMPSPKGTQPFFGTQLVFLSRQLSVIAESVDEVRFAMDSVFIGPSERQTLEIPLHVSNSGKPFSMYAEDLLSWISSFAVEEGPRLIQDGGKYAVGTAFADQAGKLASLVSAAMDPANKRYLPSAYFTGRVQGALRELAGQLNTLATQAGRVAHPIESTATRTIRPLAEAAVNAGGFAEFQKSARLEVLQKRALERRLSSTLFDSSPDEEVAS